MKKEFNLHEIEEICYEIRKIICLYFEDEDIFNDYNDEFKDEKRLRLDNRYTITYLSNGEKLTYMVKKNCLAHLLGINSDYLINNKNFTSKNSYDTLKEFASNPYKIYTLNKSGKIDLNKVISPFVNTKIENFIKNVMINLDNTVFVCKFDKSKSYASGEDFQDFNYMIVQNDNDRYYVLLLRKDDNDKYLPISNQVFDSYEELTGKMFNILQNQEITMLSSIKVFSNGLLLFQRGIANDLRLNKSLMLKHVSDELGCVPNILNDYIYSLNIISNNKTNNSYNSDLIKKIAYVISKKEPINYEKLGVRKDNIQPELIDLIDSYNDSLFKNADLSDDYNNLYNEKEALLKRLEESLKTIDELNSRISKLNKNYVDLDKKDKDMQERISEKLEEINLILRG